MTNELINANALTEDASQERIRPEYLKQFIGQEQLKSNLSVFIDATKSRGEVLDHVLLYGPPGLGKTTIAQVIAKELGVNFRTTAGPLLTKTGDIAAILTNLSEGDVLFIDEIHRLSSSIEEVLYPAMEDYHLDLVIGEGPAARTIRIDLPKFTLIGATTRIGLLTNPLRDRFGIPLRLDLYSHLELSEVVKRCCKLLSTEISEQGALEIAKRSRGTPRIAIRLMKRVRDFADIDHNRIITEEVATDALQRLGVDAYGLDSNDYRYLKYIADVCKGGPVGIDTISAALSEQKDSIEETIEPYLLQIGFIQKTPRGRILSHIANGYIDNIDKSSD